jgi:hypothetical protein
VNLIGKLANGIADELIPYAARQRDTRSDRACRQRKHDSPPGNPTHLEVLRNDGYLVVDPPKTLEIATREGLDERVGPFPYPELLMYLSAVAAGKHSAMPARPKA